jgi:hypothetical protein
MRFLNYLAFLQPAQRTYHALPWVICRCDPTPASSQVTSFRMPRKWHLCKEGQAGNKKKNATACLCFLNHLAFLPSAYLHRRDRNALARSKRFSSACSSPKRANRKY